MQTRKRSKQALQEGDTNNNNNANAHQKKKRKTEEVLYCICRKPQESGFMIACDYCNQWFHGRCVGISAAQGKKLKSYKCPLCVSSDAAPADFSVDQAGQEPEEDVSENGEEEEEENGEEEEERPEAENGEETATDEEIYAFMRDAINAEGTCTIAEVRRAFGIGYRRAKRLHDALEFTPTGSNVENKEIKDDDGAPDNKEAMSLRPRGPRGKTGISRKPKTEHHKSENTIQEESPEECDPQTMAIRNKVVASLAEALSQEKRSDTPDELTSAVPESEWKEPTAATTAIEEEMFKMFKRQTEKDYKAKYRSLLFNINANTDLRKSILNGLLTAEHLCKMTSQELAPQQLSEWRRARTEKYFAENVLITEESNAPIVKKTHKGEEILQADTVDIPAAVPKDAEGLPDVVMAPIEPTGNNEPDEQPKHSPEPLPPVVEAVDIKPIDQAKEQKPKETSPPIIKEQTRQKLKAPDPIDDLFLIQEKMALEPAIDIQLGNLGASAAMPDLTLLDPFLTPLANPPSVSSVQSLIGKDPFHRTPLGGGLAPQSGQVLWTGFLSKTNIEKCKVKALHISGPHTSAIQELLPQTLHVQGRVEFPKLAEYLLQLAKSRSREHSICCFEPQGEESEMAYIAMLHYFSLRQRAGVVINLYGAVKEMYIIPLASDDRHFRDVIHIEKGDKLVGVVVTDKRK